MAELSRYKFPRFYTSVSFSCFIHLVLVHLYLSLCVITGIKELDELLGALFCSIDDGIHVGLQVMYGIGKKKCAICRNCEKATF